MNDAQSAFIKGRLIDNIMLCQSLMHGYERKHISPRWLIKIDIRKAYDMVNWDFIDELLLYMGFSDVFRLWIMHCLTSVRYSINFNGELVGIFEGKRELRQGDPLSPLLFVLVVEYLTRSLLHTRNSGMFKFHPKCKKLKIINLCFANNLMLLCKAEEGSLQCIKKQLEAFAETTGLEANPSKSQIFFGGVEITKQNKLVELLQMEIGMFPVRYLGVPLVASRLGVKHYKSLIERITGRITSWNAKNLSYAGRLQSIRSVLLSIHVYWSRYS